MTGEAVAAVLYGALAGAAIPIGGALARIERIKPDWLETEVRHSVIAFGGGVLLGAVCFVLVPEGAARLSPLAAVGALMAGGVLFAGIDRLIQTRARGRGAQVAAMLADFLPECAALGAMLATGSPVAGLLAALIALQNLPEAFNAYRELAALDGLGGRRIIAVFAAIATLGPATALAGYALLAGSPAVLGVIMLAAAGGIVLLTFQDIAVEAHLDNRQAPPLAAVGGFALGLFGHLLTA